MLLHQYRPPMAKLVPFPARRIRRTAELVLLLSASRERLNAPSPWKKRRAPRESLGNMLQRLALLRPHAVVVLESIVEDMLNILEQ